jgi:uncharacterized protein
MSDDVAFADEPEQRRYEVRLDGELAGRADYRREQDVITFTHTEVDPAYEGQGLGSRLVRFALDDVRERGLRVIPRCPFIRSWIADHDDYADLVVPGREQG